MDNSVLRDGAFLFLAGITEEGKTESWEVMGTSVL